MRIRSLAPLVVTLSLLGASPVLAAQTPNEPAAKHRLPGTYVDQQGTQPPAKTDSKPEAKPADAKTASAANLAGKWNINIENPNGAMQASLDLKADPKDAKKVAGLISSQIGEANLEGEVVDGKLTFHFTMNNNGTDLAVAFTGTVQKDGSLAGTLEYGQGPIGWTATREKK